MVIRDSVVNLRSYRIERGAAINQMVARKRRANCPTNRGTVAEPGVTMVGEMLERCARQRQQEEQSEGSPVT